jgi:hypothetical protein
MDRTRGYLLSIAALLLCLSCGDETKQQCESSGDCVGRPAGNYCKPIEGKNRCVIECAPATNGGTDTCPATYKCTGKADDESFFCKPA